MTSSVVRSAVQGLRGALDAAAEAVADPNLDALLASEVAIERSLAGLPPMAALDAAERDAVREELEGARLALVRCRRLGATLNDVIRLILVSLESRQGALEYGPRARGEDFAGRALDRTV